MVRLDDRAKKEMTAIRFYLLGCIDIFYDGRGLRREGSEGSEGSKGSERGKRFLGLTGPFGPEGSQV
jgi:hypothetical protein